MEDCVGTQTGGLCTASGSEMVRRKTPRGRKDCGVCSLTPGICRRTLPGPVLQFPAMQPVEWCEGGTDLCAEVFLTVSSSSRSGPPRTGQKLQEGRIEPESSLSSETMVPVSCGVFLFLSPCLIHQYVYTLLCLTHPKDGKHVLQLGQGLDASRGSAIGIIRIHG